MFGGGSLYNKDSETSLNFTPYNDDTEDVKLPSAKLGKVTVSHTGNSTKDAIYESWTFYGGIHLGSTEDELLEQFGNPYDKKEAEDYNGDPNTKYDFRGSTIQKFEFTVKEGVVSEMSWTNYGMLAN